MLNRRRYNNISVNENHHCACVWKMLAKPELNITANLASEQWRELRKLVRKPTHRCSADTLLNAASQNVQTVQTVRKRENGNRSSLEEIAVGDIFESDLFTASAFEQQVVTMFMGTDMSKHFDLLTKFKLRIEAEQFDLGTQEDRTMLCCAVVHAADLSNVCRP